MDLNDRIAERVAEQLAARQRRNAAKRKRRAELERARQYGLAHRMADRQRRIDERNQR